MRINKVYLILVSLIISLGGFLLGFGGAVISGATPFYSIDFGLPDNPWLIGLSVSAIILGSIFGNTIAGPMSDRLGRKPALLISSVLFILSALGAALAGNIILFILVRIMGGIAVGIAILIAPILIAEISPPQMRGKLVTFNQLNIVFGVSVAYFSNYIILNQINNTSVAWRWMMGIGVFPSVLYLILLFLVPESPRWLILRNSVETARKILQKIGDKEYSDQEIKNIKQSITSETGAVTAKPSELLSRRLRLVMLVGMGLAFFQQVSGINAIFYYAPMIFGLAGVGQNTAFLQAIVVGVTNVVVTLIAMFLIDRVGRKPMLLIGSALMAISLFIASFAFYQATFSLKKENISTIKQSIVDDALKSYVLQMESLKVQPDSISMKHNKIQLYYEGRTVKEIASMPDELTFSVLEADFIEKVLHTVDNQIFTNDLAFYNKIFMRLRAELLNHLKDNQNNPLDYAFKDYLSDSGMQVSTNTVSDYILEKRFPYYKSLLLKNCIHIGSIWVLLAILGFITGFSLSLGPVTWIMLSEIFPNRFRGLAISVAGTFNALTSFAVATMFPIELEKMGSGTTFLIYVIFMVLCFLFVWRFVPETKGKSLEQIESELT